MTTKVTVNTYTHSVNFVTNNLLRSLKEIIREIGLDPTKLSDSWSSKEEGISTWLESKDLQKVILEVYKPSSGLVKRWDFEVEYGSSGDGTFQADIEEIKYHISKAGSAPEDCEYRIIATTKKGAPDVPGWCDADLHSTEEFVEHSIGTTIDGDSISSKTSYWKKTND